ncbi:MAG: hypothetical protein DWQ51_15450 [Microcystis wesenbergii TW10]|jgi:hypothetical protein|uniref:Uncharacterized protein n=3 Tax=Microcystis TaxID=1125 RepID=A0A0A1VPH7_MICAE|nr:MULTISPECIES: hypothetical protein [Microcystis]MCZ8105518.1 hypothetical protein [Burkholderiales bacterium]REJ50456.1 MAG: hypothetical protein DWQ51_15450 [Microcystis wesenbergii TW10]MBD2119143.1 hypothetical protein [Microcystis wesenbergii FACHB-1339]MCZ8040637.1 hypothetical protein [Microcystis sp. LE17-20A]MCZ8211163.1 hypothetical protein [Microcystis sp. LE19-8.1F]
MSNALDRLVNKKKPSVPPRIDVVEEILPIPSQPKEEIAELTQDAIKNLSQDSKTSLSQDTNTETDLDDFETVRNTIRLDRAIDDSLRQLCQDERITKETLLEAAYLYLDAHPTELEEVVRTARQRLQRRKEIADYKRAKTMQERFLKS